VVARPIGWSDSREPGSRELSAEGLSSRGAGSGGPTRGELRAKRRQRHQRAALQGALSVLTVLAVGTAGSYLLFGRGDAAGGHPPQGSAGRDAGRSRVLTAADGAGSSRAAVSITWVGDMTFGTLGSYPAEGASWLISGVRRYLGSDLTIGNLETALGSLPTSKCAPGESDCYAFEAPASTALALRRAGFSAVNVANNHTMDAGPAGEVSTDAALRKAHLVWDGRPGEITYLVRNGIRIALLGFAPWSYDANMLDIPAAQALVRQARRHARVVIVMMHAGAEGLDAQHVRPGEEYYLGQDRGNSIAFTHAVIDAGADLVMGSGPHVLRAMQWYRGHLIAYSLGNFCGYNTLAVDGVTGDSAILHVTLRANGSFVRGSITPIVLTQPGTPEPDPARTGIALIDSLSQQDFGGNGAVRISAAGRIEVPRR
jgi:poly-gamma-glutamate capsule biosynthesis protein CapA/YwtB (metallophosphatase superfamily)